MDSLEHLWVELGLPQKVQQNISLVGEGLGLPSSFKIGHLAEASIRLTALLAALLYSMRTNKCIPHITVPLQHAAVEFK